MARELFYKGYAGRAVVTQVSLRPLGLAASHVAFKQNKKRGRKNAMPV